MNNAVTNNKLYCLILISFFIVLFPAISFASTGTIGTTTNAAWSNEIGWVNFAPTNGGLTITDSAITGSAWSQNYGWINFAPTNGGVMNDGQGNLSGSAWGDNLGWIDFSGVTINPTTGKFSGQATGTIIGTLTFDCTNCDVVTDWRPTVVTPPSGGGGGGGSGGGGGFVNLNQPPTAPSEPTPSPSPEPTPTPPSEPTPSPSPEPTPTPPSEPTPSPSPEPTPTPPSEPTPTSESMPTPGPAPSIGSTITSIVGGSISSVGSFITSAVNGLSQNLTILYNSAPVAVKTVVGNTKKFVQTKTGSAVTKTISTVGVATGLSLPVAAAATSFSDLWLILGRMFGFFLEVFGIRKKSRPWGTVFDSVTKRPLDPVLVTLTDVTTGKQAASAITDIDGRYGFLAVPGTYRIQLMKTNYVFPSIKMKGRLFDEVYNDLYFGDTITTVTGNETITKNIPMDPMSFNWNEFAKTKMNVNKFMKGKDITWARISSLIFTIGAIVAIIAVLVVPEPYNMIIAGFYVLAYIMNYVVFKTKKAGSLIEKATNQPLSFAIVNIYREGETTPFTKKIADKFGGYYALVPNGNYYLHVDKKNDDESYSALFQTPVFSVSKGVINVDVKG